MNETLIAAMRTETPVWSIKDNDWRYVVEIWPNGTYFLAESPKTTGTSRNLCDIDLTKNFKDEN